MTETIVFGDVVALCVDYLTAALAAAGDTSTHVGSRHADDRSIVVRLVDAEVRNIVLQRSTVSVECQVGDGPTSQEDAHDLAQRARGFLAAMQGTVQAGTTVYKVNDANVPSGLADSPDTTTGRNRYTFHVAISIRGEATDDDAIYLTTDAGEPFLVV